MSDFDAFWAAFRHPKPPRSRGDKQACRALWEGRKLTKHRLRITADMHGEIMAGAWAHNEITMDTENAYLVTAEVWLMQHRWETDMESLEDQRESSAEARNAAKRDEHERRLEASKRAAEEKSRALLERNLRLVK